jgi:hypothetical protein
VLCSPRSCQVPNSGPIVAIVDDDNAVGNAIEVLMRSIGLAAQAFSSGEEFLRSPELSRTGCLEVDDALSLIVKEGNPGRKLLRGRLTGGCGDGLADTFDARLKAIRGLVELGLRAKGK